MLLIGENGGLALASTGCALVDLFCECVPDTPLEELHQLLDAAWKADPRVTLSLIFNIGGCHKGNGGKSDKHNFVRALLWLSDHHPETFLANLCYVQDHGCVRTLLDLVVYKTHVGKHEHDLLASEQHKALRAGAIKAFNRARRRAKRQRQVQLKRGYAASLGLQLEDCMHRPTMPLNHATQIQPPCAVSDYAVQCVAPSLEYVQRGVPTGVMTTAFEYRYWSTIESWEHQLEGPRRHYMKHTKPKRKHVKLENQTKPKRKQHRQWREDRAGWVPQDLLQQDEECARGSYGRSKWWGYRFVSTELKEGFTIYAATRQQRLRSEASQLRELARQARNMLVAGRQPGGTVDRLRQEVCRIFATGLQREYSELMLGKSVGGLYAKWAPSPKKAHDRHTLLVDELITHLPSSLLLEHGSDMHPRTRYQRLLSRLRRAAQIPESFTGTREWGLVEYSRMPALCRRMYGHTMYRLHDEERYDAFLQAAQDAIIDDPDGNHRPKVNVGGVQPHDVIRMAEADEAGADLMWYEMVRQVRKSCVWRGNCVPVCDVSGSMSGIPMEVAIALSMLLAESAPVESAWHGRLFTFSENPMLVTIPNIPTYDDNGNMGSLKARAAFVRGMEWGMNTNLEAVFEDILQRVSQQSGASIMPESIVIFSDMEFDEALGAGQWDTMHEHIQRRFAEYGYGTLPTLVYWNLRSSRSVPADAHAKGVLLLSGFSAAMVETFVASGTADLTPSRMMHKLLDRPCYNCLTLVD
jgi:hypothetical protein